MDTYKYIFSEENVRTVSLSESKVVQVFKATQLYHQKHCKEIILKPLETIVQWDDPFKKGFKIKKIDNNILDTFSDMLKLPNSIPMWLKIFLDAKDQAILVSEGGTFTKVPCT